MAKPYKMNIKWQTLFCWLKLEFYASKYLKSLRLLWPVSITAGQGTFIIYGNKGV